MAKDPETALFEAVNRDRIRTVACPYCYSPPGQLCQAGARFRKASHLQRVQKYRTSSAS